MIAYPRLNSKGIRDEVASYNNGVGYGKWTHIDGWSESVIVYHPCARAERSEN